MANCLFCDDFVGEVNGDGGTKGYTIGNKDVCLACLSELKYRLEAVQAKPPVERVLSEKQTKEIEKTREYEDSPEDPFRARTVDDE